ncbi:MAG: penicillin acylase family protein [Nitrosomonas sp.]|nr:penicillin acylase family protein [Nitrosomonas sp.]
MLKKLAAILFFLMMLTAVIAWLLLAGSLPRYEGAQSVTGLLQAVTVERDSAGSATLTGHNRLDLARALGYVHAQERFFEMDLLRRKASGELAELFGSLALTTDRGARKHRFRSRAQEMLQALPDEQRTLLAAYAEGANQGLAGLTVRPFPYLLTQTAPQNWRSEDSLLVVMAMYLTLQEASVYREAGLSIMRFALPESAYRFLTASGGEWDAPLDGAPFEWPAFPTESELDLRTLDKNLLRDIEFQEVYSAGSNGFAAMGNLADGRALIANDMHLELRVPNLWFRTRLIYPDPDHSGQMIDVTGVSLPGAPAIVVGANRHIAWGFTNAYGDFADWVRVTLHPEDASRYHHDGEWMPLAVHAETIQVKNAPAETLTVVETDWGPILENDHDNVPLALAWVAHRAGAVNFDLVRLESARSVHDAVRIAPDLGIPAQNLIVGDKTGDIGWTIAGRVPARSGNVDFGLPASWEQDNIGWQGWAAPEDYPRIVNPPGGRIWNGNSRMVDGDMLDWLGDGGYELGARSQQIRNGLLARNRFSPADLLAIQLDNRAMLLERWKKLLDEVLLSQSSDWSQAMQQALRDWNGYASIQSVSYRLVRNFRHEVMRRALSGFVAKVKTGQPDFSLPRLNQVEHAVWQLLEQQPPHLLSPGYQSWRNLLVLSAKHIAEVAQSQPGGIMAYFWGKENTAKIHHPFSRALPKWLAGFLNMPADPLPGDHHMPRVQGVNFGASIRFGVIPGDEAAGYFHMPGGQSGHPLAPYYKSGHNDWVTGRASPFLPGVSEHRLLLSPDD